MHGGAGGNSPAIIPFPAVTTARSIINTLVKPNTNIASSENTSVESHAVTTNNSNTPATKILPPYTKPATVYRWPQPEFAKFAAPVDLKAPRIKELLQMHTYMRPGGSATEKKFCNVYLRGLGCYRDEAGNYIVRIGGPNPTVLWSSHTDTVHRTEGKQKLTFGGGFLTLADDEKRRECLGADCTVGVWIMRQMILRKIPGLYIFHAFEETGGIGSRFIASKTPDLLKGINYAIAFDRKGISSVITHQMSRCASDEFGAALATALNTPGKFTTDDSGTFTDTANYTGLIPECTNISVGYWGQHGATECLDVGFADHLLNRMCSLDVNSLPVKRDPNASDEYRWDSYDGGYGYGYGYRSRGKYQAPSSTSHNTRGSSFRSTGVYDGDYTDSDELIDLVYLCKQYPGVVARFLLANGFTADDVEQDEVRATIESANIQKRPEIAEEDSGSDKAGEETEVLDLTQAIKSLEDGGLDCIPQEGEVEDLETGLRRTLGKDFIPY
jgi:hypothetical protein